MNPSKKPKLPPPNLFTVTTWYALSCLVGSLSIKFALSFPLKSPDKIVALVVWIKLISLSDNFVSVPAKPPYTLPKSVAVKVAFLPVPVGLYTPLATHTSLELAPAFIAVCKSVYASVQEEPSLLPVAFTSTNIGFSINVAVIFLSASMITVSGLVKPVASPVHPSNW